MSLCLSTKVVNREVGSIQWLRDCAPEVWQGFYKQASSMSSSEIGALCQRTVVATKTKSWSWANNGEFKPMSVWKQLGWDTDAIKAKATGADMKTCPTYGWLCYRVRIHSENEAEQRENKDALNLVAKARTRALKRKASDAPSQPSDPPASFSSQSSSSSSEERAAPARRGKGSKAKGKAKAKVASVDKETKEINAAKNKIKAKAKAALKKVAPALLSLRTTYAHPLILEAEDDVVDPVKKDIRFLSSLEKAAQEAVHQGVDNFSEHFDNFDWKASKQQERALTKSLLKLEKKR